MLRDRTMVRSCNGTEVAVKHFSLAKCFLADPSMEACRLTRLSHVIEVMVRV